MLGIDFNSRLDSQIGALRSSVHAALRFGWLVQDSSLLWPAWPSQKRCGDLGFRHEVHLPLVCKVSGGQDASASVELLPLPAGQGLRIEFSAGYDAHRQWAENFVLVFWAAGI